MSQAGKGVIFKAMGSLLVSCIMLALMLWRFGITPSAASIGRVRDNGPGVCSTAEAGMEGDSSPWPQPPKPPHMHACHMVVYIEHICLQLLRQVQDTGLQERSEAWIWQLWAVWAARPQPDAAVAGRSEHCDIGGVTGSRVVGLEAAHHLARAAASRRGRFLGVYGRRFGNHV